MTSHADSSDTHILDEFFTNSGISESTMSKDKKEISHSYPVSHSVGSVSSYIVHQKPGSSSFAESTCDNILSSFKMFMRQKFYFMPFVSGQI